MYKVVNKFRDKDGKVYESDTIYESADGERINTLATTDNKYGKVYIEKIEVNYPNHTGGGYYELSNGEKVQGKEKAEQAEQALNEEEQALQE